MARARQVNIDDYAQDNGWLSTSCSRDSAADAGTDPQHEWSAASHKRLMLFSGRSNAHLASASPAPGVQLGRATLKTFPNGEIYARYDESIRGADVFIVQSCSPARQRLPDGAADHGRRRAPRLGQARHRGHAAVTRTRGRTRSRRRASPSRRASSRRCMHAAGIDRVLTMDLHAGQVQGFFDGPVDHMTALPMFAQYFRDRACAATRSASSRPTPGRTKLAKKFAEMLDTTFAIISKERPSHSEAEVIESSATSAAGSRSSPTT